MMTNLTIGDTVIAKHNNIWQKGHITNIYANSPIRHFYVTFYDELTSSDGPYCRADIIKVDSNFNTTCKNCKYFDKMIYEDPCNKCLLGRQHCHWEPCDSLKNKDKLNGNDIKAFSIDEGPFTDKKVNYSYISTSRNKTVNMLERRIHDQLLASPLKIEKLDMTSMYPDLKGGYKLDYSKNIPYHSDSIDALRYSINDARYFAEFMADFNKKENKNMKKQQKKRDRNIIKVKDLETRKIKEIMFNGPATIIKWDPTWIQLSGDKTVTVCKEPDKLDKTTGFLLAVLKEVLTNQSYGNILEKIDEIKKSDELSTNEDIDPKYDEHIPEGTIALLNEVAEAMNNAFHIGSRVKYIHGKQVYRVIDCTYIPTKHEMYYTLSAYHNAILSEDETPKKIYNVAHHRLKEIKRR